MDALVVYEGGQVPVADAVVPDQPHRMPDGDPPAAAVTWQAPLAAAFLYMNSMMAQYSVWILPLVTLCAFLAPRLFSMLVAALLKRVV